MKLIAILSIAISLAACSSIQPAKKPFTVDLRSPKVTAGTIEGQFDKFLSIGGLKKYDISVDYYPKENAVCVQYRVDFCTYYQFWDKANRDAFIIALDKYKEDYSKRNFGKSSRKTKRNYGTLQGYLIWQMSQYTIRANSHPDIDIGYYFKDKAPYFTLNQRRTEYTDEITKNRRESPEITIFFTRAQADSLAALFDQQYLQGLAAADSGNADTEANDYYFPDE